MSLCTIHQCENPIQWISFVIGNALNDLGVKHLKPVEIEEMVNESCYKLFLDSEMGEWFYIFIDELKKDHIFLYHTHTKEMMIVIYIISIIDIKQKTTRLQIIL